MFCSKCGCKLSKDSNFCPNCGTAVQVSDVSVKRLQMVCNHCNGVMNVDCNRSILLCPYCGSKDLIIESDTVIIERIRSQTLKDIEISKQKTTKDIELTKLFYEEEKEQRKSKSDWEETKKGLKLACVLWSALFAMALFFNITIKLSGKVAVPSASEEFIGKHASYVCAQFEDAGFNNIEVVQFEDSKDTTYSQNGLVREITINGKSTFDESDLFHKNSTIRIFITTE